MNLSTRSLVRLGAACLVGLPLATAAAADTADEFEYTEPQTGYYTIAPTDLAPDKVGTGYNYFQYWDGAYLRGLAQNLSNCFNTGLHLPHRAKITGLRLWVQSTASRSIPLRVMSGLLSTGEATQYLQTSISDDSGERKVFVFDFPTPIAVNNANRTYGFGICLSAGQQFYGGRLTYTYDNAGD